MQTQQTSGFGAAQTIPPRSDSHAATVLAGDR